MAIVEIVLINPKSPTNVGGVLRAAGCFGVNNVKYTGNRFDNAQKFATDTKQIGDTSPLNKIETLTEVQKSDTKIIAVELTDGATPLPHFTHPENAVYVFGPEDGSLQKQHLRHCDDVVYIPTHGCMNLAATVNVLLYDRLAKSQNTNYSQAFLLKNRDKNNRARFTR